MTTVRITHGTVALGQPVYVGQILEVDDRVAEILVGLNKAEIVSVTPVAPPAKVETATDKKAEKAVKEAQHRTGRWGRARR